jgi:uncharacterized protein YggE
VYPAAKVSHETARLGALADKEDAMRSETFSRSPWRRFASATGMASLAAVAFLALHATAALGGASGIPGTPLRQIESLGAGASTLTVTGGGEVTVPAETAAVQILLGTDPAGFSVSGFEERDRAGGSESAVSVGGQSAPRERRGGRDETAGGIANAATPVADAGALSEERLGPVVAALETAGVDPDSVETTFSPLATEPYGRRSGSARLAVVVAEPTSEELAALARSVSDAASSEGLVVEMYAVAYRVADCAALEERALEAAVDDARERAERLAAALGVGIGDPVGAFDFGPQDRGEDGACTNRSGFSYGSDFGGLGVTLPPFDAAAPAEVSVVSSLTVSYAVEPAGG